MKYYNSTWASLLPSSRSRAPRLCPPRPPQGVFLLWTAQNTNVGVRTKHNRLRTGMGRAGPPQRTGTGPARIPLSGSRLARAHEDEVQEAQEALVPTRQCRMSRRLNQAMRFGAHIRHASYNSFCDPDVGSTRVRAAKVAPLQPQTQAYSDLLPAMIAQDKLATQARAAGAATSGGASRSLTLCVKAPPSSSGRLGTPNFAQGTVQAGAVGCGAPVDEALNERPASYPVLWACKWLLAALGVRPPAPRDSAQVPNGTWYPRGLLPRIRFETGKRSPSIRLVRAFPMPDEPVVVIREVLALDGCLSALPCCICSPRLVRFCFSTAIHPSKRKPSPDGRTLSDHGSRQCHGRRPLSAAVHAVHSQSALQLIFAFDPSNAPVFTHLGRRRRSQPRALPTSSLACQRMATKPCMLVSPDAVPPCVWLATLHRHRLVYPSAPWRATWPAAAGGA
ncbi:hypothetical protein ACCO45_005161 [Purpureocillium lilacinum]|uniref:Uncharacterized protein n=1 Tax=Purpureocillium lilacinum TaxID=33203 RepID=A0ACC4DWW6_PURLI